ncbi:hypothetical protein WJX84_006217 [Apatococcus fuscideae]|uniref:Chromo domain-containing protein n=1 Tax=Apatococcus fuscideae TaxID=2026836 RepID=A0AAW1RJ62_9CHLO
MSNIAENLVRDFEDKWWNACRKGDEAAMAGMLHGDGRVLANALDENRRSGLHFAAAVGNPRCARLLLKAGADVDVSDKEGYTPLHMASGYFHTATVQVLLEGGADPGLEDRQGRDPVKLIDNLREATPLNPATMGSRTALEEVASMLTGDLFDEVEPAMILEVRKGDGPKQREFLVKFSDGHEDCWVREKDMARDLIDDFDAGRELAEADAIIEQRLRGDTIDYLIRWQDDMEPTWESEDQVSQHLINQSQ